MAFAYLTYHSLADGRFPDAQYPTYATTRDQFAAHLPGLIEAGFQIGTFADSLQSGEGKSPLPDNLCVLTFADGHTSSLELAELMSIANVRGTFFLTINYCRDREDFLKPPAMRELAAAGFDFGTHGVTHRALSGMSDVEMRAELCDSKRWLEDALGRPVRTMSLPAGQGSESVRAAAFELGCRLVGTSVEKMNTAFPPPRSIAL